MNEHTWRTANALIVSEEKYLEEEIVILSRCINGSETLVVK